jgi:hypothetical protein
MEGKFNNAFILSGGGTRVMIYLGIYAALEELQMKPDVLIATCGGAFASTVINAFPDNNSRKDYLKSKEYYQFATKERLTQEKKLAKIGVLSINKILNKQNAPYIENVFTKYLATLPQDLSEEFPSLEHTSFSSKTPTLIIGSEILFKPDSIGEKRKGEKLYQKIIFTDATTAKRIDIAKTAIISENYKNSAVATLAKIKSDISMLTSTRISVSDMFYVAPFYSKGTYFAGGAIDLIPIELAKHIANTVVIEKKQVYSPIEEALVRAVLGYSGNKRLEEIQRFVPEYQIDTSNIKEELEGNYIKKYINWKKFEINFSFPDSYEKFKETMDKQWNYGYQQTMKSIQRKK